MYHVRRKKDNQYLYYISTDSCSFGSMRNACTFDTPEQAHQFKQFAERYTKEKCEIVSVVTKISVVEESKEETIETPSDEE